MTGLKEEKRPLQNSKKKWELLANLFSVFSMIAGLLSIYLSFETNWDLAARFIFLGLVFDFMDGFVAKRTGCESAIGKELDSFGDFIVSGVAVFFLLFNLFSNMFPLSLFFILIPIATEIRLAKFNVQNDKENFIGIPTFITSIILCALVVAQIHTFEIILGFAIVLSFLMISNIKIPTFNTIKRRVGIVYIVLFLMVMLVTFFYYPLLIIAFIAIYLIISKQNRCARFLYKYLIR
ncbi:CDP-alcohol phosphatidyltransferase family protein [Candidatus Micrarchaeota archaeon]|nr:CDP-alcohol phosphatidyltransferase family protein [Candidatus Micrarchaeota archaeon]